MNSKATRPISAYPPPKMAVHKCWSRSPMDRSTISFCSRRCVAFFSFYLGFDITQDLQPVDWLTFGTAPGDHYGRRLFSMTSWGWRRSASGLPTTSGCLAVPAGGRLRRIGQEDHLMGRAGMVADEVGSALIGGTAGKRLHAPVLPDGKDLRAVCKMVRFGLQTIVLRRQPVAGLPGRFTCRNLAAAEVISSGLTKNWPPATMRQVNRLTT